MTGARTRRRHNPVYTLMVAMALLAGPAVMTVRAQPANKAAKEKAAKPVKKRPAAAGKEKAAKPVKKRPAAAGKVKKLSPLQQAERLLDAPDPDKVRAGLEQLGLIGKPAVVRPISERLRQGLNPPLMLLAIETLMATKSPRAGPILIELCSHRRAAIRAAAVGALGELRVRTAREVLREALDDSEPAVRAAAAGALTRMRDRGTLKTLYALFERGEKPALEAIAALATPVEIKRLLGYLEDRPLSALEPAFIALFERKSFPRPGKMSLIAGLTENGSPDAEQFLRDRLAKLSGAEQAPLSRAIGKALETIQRRRMEKTQAATEARKAEEKQERIEPKKPEAKPKKAKAAGEPAGAAAKEAK